MLGKIAGRRRRGQQRMRWLGGITGSTDKSLSKLRDFLMDRDMRYSRQKYWSELPFPFPGDLPNLRIEPGSPALQADSSPTEL